MRTWRKDIEVSKYQMLELFQIIAKQFRRSIAFKCTQEVKFHSRVIAAVPPQLGEMFQRSTWISMSVMLPLWAKKTHLGTESKNTMEDHGISFPPQFDRDLWRDCWRCSTSIKNMLSSNIQFLAGFLALCIFLDAMVVLCANPDEDVRSHRRTSRRQRRRRQRILQLMQADSPTLMFYNRFAPSPTTPSTTRPTPTQGYKMQKYLV